MATANTEWEMILNKKDIGGVYASGGNLYWRYSDAQPTVGVRQGFRVKRKMQMHWDDAPENIWVAADKETDFVLNVVGATA